MKKRKYKHITVKLLADMKERYMTEAVSGKTTKGEKATPFLGSLWIGDFIRYVVEHKNDDRD